MQNEMAVFDTKSEVGRSALIQDEQQRAAHIRAGQQIYAKIKRSSKYFGQTGEDDLFQVYVEAHKGEYVVSGGPGGQYRLADVNLYVVGGDGFALRLS
jgi:hypothetical protein